MGDSRRTRVNYDAGAAPAVSGGHTMVLAIFSGRERWRTWVAWIFPGGADGGSIVGRHAPPEGVFHGIVFSAMAMLLAHQLRMRAGTERVTSRM
jgi:hypothetical protein